MTEENPIFNISVDPEECEDRSDILYNKEFSIVPGDNKPPPQRAKFQCFNCGSNEHQAAGCLEKFNRQNFMKNKALFNMQKQQQQVGLSNSREFKRYHVDSGAVPTEARPGVISDALRNALGINSTQLPPYIYKMRSMGYPPGWLEEAKISSSGLKMLDSKGERVRDLEEEEGEIYVVKTRFDFSKIVDYPGFNVWPSADTINETHLFGALPMDYAHSKERFINNLRKQMEEETNDEGSTEDLAEDMDAEEIEDDVELFEGKGDMIPPLPAEEPPALPPLPPSELSSESLELEEGEVPTVAPKKQSRKRRSKEKNDDDELETSTKSPRTSLSQNSVHDKTEELSTGNDTIGSTNGDSYHTANNTLDSSFGRVISIELSTPSLKTHSPFFTLPPSEAFRKDISDVIQFENLPNSTGKYEKLKTVLRQVRNKLNVFRKN